MLKAGFGQSTINTTVFKVGLGQRTMVSMQYYDKTLSCSGCITTKHYGFEVGLGQSTIVFRLY